MIFYKNLKKHKKTSEKNIVFSVFGNGVVSNKDDLTSKPNECKKCYNISFVDGALKNGLGFEDLSVPATVDDLNTTHGFDFSERVEEICGIWMDRWYSNGENELVYQMLLIDANHRVWTIPLIDEDEGFVWSKSKLLTSEPTYCCPYRIDNLDCTLFFSKEGMVCLSLAYEGMFENVPSLISCVVHYDNFFGIKNTNRNTLVYTTNLNLQNWSDEESSTIEFLDNRGSFTKLVAFNDYVYLFRENGITKISIYTSKKDFSFTHLYTSASKIFEDSVCVCGNKVLFMTRDGFYSFNGNSVDKIMPEADVYFKNLDNTNCSSACLNGKYYLATKCDFADEENVGCESETYVNNVLFEVDIDTFALQVYRGVDVRKVLAVDNPYMSKLCACFYNENKQKIGQLVPNGKTFSNSNLKVWKSFKTDLENRGKRKKIKELIINSKYDCQVVISSDEETKTFEILGSEKEQRLSISLYGKLFEVEFRTNQANIEICKPMLVFDVVS